MGKVNGSQPQAAWTGRRGEENTETSTPVQLVRNEESVAHKRNESFGSSHLSPLDHPHPLRVASVSQAYERLIRPKTLKAQRQMKPIAVKGRSFQKLSDVSTSIIILAFGTKQKPQAFGVKNSSHSLFF